MRKALEVVRDMLFAIAVFLLICGKDIAREFPKPAEPEIPVVYLPGISGPEGYCERQIEFEKALTEVEQVRGLTVAQELAYMKQVMGYTQEEKREAADIAIKAVAFGYESSIKMHEEMKQEAEEQMAIPEAPVWQDDRFKCTTIWNYNYTREDVKILGDVIWAEIEEFCDDPDGEYIAKVTGSVVLHRVANKSYFPNTVYAVIHDGEGKSYQQYASRTIRAIGNTNTPDYVYEWAEDILRDGPIGPANLVFQDNRAHGTVWLEYKGVYYCTSDKL